MEPIILGDHLPFPQRLSNVIIAPPRQCANINVLTYLLMKNGGDDVSQRHEGKGKRCQMVWYIDKTRRRSAEHLEMASTQYGCSRSAPAVAVSVHIIIIKVRAV